jgi:hypothetical protein
MKISSRILVILVLFMVGSCTVAPSEDNTRKAIADYFDRQHYRVVDLRIGKSEGVPLSQTTYMGTPGYIVEIPTITLEAQQDKPDVKKGTRLTFSDAKIRMVRDAEKKNLWHVSIISGITVY